MPRTFTEFALCHLPDEEIETLHAEIRKCCRIIYGNVAGFFIWRGFRLPETPNLNRILDTITTDYALFDVDVEPDPNLEIFEDA